MGPAALRSGAAGWRVVEGQPSWRSIGARMVAGCLCVVVVAEEVRRGAGRYDMLTIEV